MLTFTQTFEDLKQLVTRLGYSGQWSDVQNGKQFRSSDGAILNWFTKTGSLQCQGKQEIRERLDAALHAEIEGVPLDTKPAAASAVAVRESGTEREKVFVVHGHDSTAREQLELVLLRLELNPFVLANTAGGGLTIIEALEAEIGPGPGRARFGIVLLTPDDMGYVKSIGPEDTQPRARQNVVLEMGMLLSALGRQNVAILKKGHIEIPSDAQGILYIPFNDHVKEVVPKLVDRLRAAGFDLKPAAITRAST